MSEPFLGQIQPVAFNFPPRGWAFCDGQLMAISQNTALFSLLGTTYGGDGRVNFALPNLQGRLPMHVGGSGAGPGLSPRVLGDTAGEEAVTLIETELPAHAHTVSTPASDDERTTDRPAGAYPTMGGIYAKTADSVSPMAAGATSDPGNQPHDNLQPYLVLNFVIALQGVFPARS